MPAENSGSPTYSGDDGPIAHAMLTTIIVMNLSIEYCAV